MVGETCKTHMFGEFILWRVGQAKRFFLGDRLVVKQMKVNQTSIVVLLDDQTSYEVLGQAKSCFLGDRLVVYTRQAMRCFLMTSQAMRCLDEQRVDFWEIDWLSVDESKPYKP